MSDRDDDPFSVEWPADGHIEYVCLECGVVLQPSEVDDHLGDHTAITRIMRRDQYEDQYGEIDD